MCEICKYIKGPCVACNRSIQELNGGKHFGKHYYMVQNHIWAAYGVKKGLLCLDCLEDRMGRKMEACDFTNTMVNIFLNPYVRELKGKTDILYEMVADELIKGAELIFELPPL